MYTSVPKIKELGQRNGDNRPIVLCEYSHSINNSNGNIHLYWDAFWDQKLPRLQGGFVWDMIDQGLRKKTKSGREYYGYGGDFGDVINDRQFCINVSYCCLDIDWEELLRKSALSFRCFIPSKNDAQGMFSPEREPHPSVHEIKYLQQPVKVIVDNSDVQLALQFPSDGFSDAALVDKNSGREAKLILRNCYSFLSLDHLVWKWTIISSLSDQPLGGGLAILLTSHLNFDQSELSAISTKERLLRDNAEYYLNIEGTLAEDASWAPAGHLVCQKQLPIAIAKALEKGDNGISSLAIGSLQTKESSDSVEIYSDSKSLSVSISKMTGFISSLQLTSRSVIGGHGLETSYTRATTDNDRGGMELVLEHMMVPWLKHFFFLLYGTRNFSHHMHWKEYGLTQEKPPKSVCTTTTIEKSDGAVVVTCNSNVVSTTRKVIMTQAITYTISLNGTIRVAVSVVPTPWLKNIPSLPRLGLTLEIGQDLEQIQYFGRGPHENYPDRKSGSHFGVWNTTPSEMGYDYIVPSENGSRSDCQWISCKGKGDDAGLLVVADGSGSFSCSALHHTATELESAVHTSDLDERHDGQHPIFVNIDHELMGVAGDVSWFPCVYPPFLVKAEPYEYT
jgi:beta-galactosidase